MVDLFVCLTYKQVTTNITSFRFFFRCIGGVCCQCWCSCFFLSFPVFLRFWLFNTRPLSLCLCMCLVYNCVNFQTLVTISFSGMICCMFSAKYTSVVVSGFSELICCLYRAFGSSYEVVFPLTMPCSFLRDDATKTTYFSLDTRKTSDRCVFFVSAVVVVDLLSSCLCVRVSLLLYAFCMVSMSIRETPYENSPSR